MPAVSLCASGTTVLSKVAKLPQMKSKELGSREEAWVRVRAQVWSVQPRLCKVAARDLAYLPYARRSCCTQSQGGRILRRSDRVRCSNCFFPSPFICTSLKETGLGGTNRKFPARVASSEARIRVSNRKR